MLRAVSGPGCFDHDVPKGLPLHKAYLEALEAGGLFFARRAASPLCRDHQGNDRSRPGCYRLLPAERALMSQCRSYYWNPVCLHGAKWMRTNKKGQPCVSSSETSSIHSMKSFWRELLRAPWPQRKKTMHLSNLTVTKRWK